MMSIIEDLNQDGWLIQFYIRLPGKINWGAAGAGLSTCFAVGLCSVRRPGLHKITEQHN